MLNKKPFVKAINELLVIKKLEDELQDVLKKIDPDWNFISFSRYENLVVTLLKEAIGDRYDYISWWLYEDVEKVVWSDDERWDLTTPEQLFEFIVYMNSGSMTKR